MTNSGFRCLILAAVVAVCTSLSTSSNAKAEEAVRAVADAEKDPAIQIVPGVPQVGEAVKVVIAPANQKLFGQESEQDDAPILVAPYEEKDSEKAKGDKKPAKPSAKGKAAVKKKETVRAKSASKKTVEKKSAAAPMAKETASEKARAEWQKNRSSETAASKTVKAAADKASRSAAAAKKREMLANGPSTAGAVASVRASKQPAAKSDHSASARKDSRSYREIYNSIPFNRAEYDANPGYRHQATMEIMLGQLHPIIVAPPQQETKQEITIRLLPVVRPGYRPYWQYPWR